MCFSELPSSLWKIALSSQSTSPLNAVFEKTDRERTKGTIRSNFAGRWPCVNQNVKIEPGYFVGLDSLVADS